MPICMNSKLVALEDFVEVPCDVEHCACQRWSSIVLLHLQVSNLGDAFGQDVCRRARIGYYLAKALCIALFQLRFVPFFPRPCIL
jgi:hypothetical protein